MSKGKFITLEGGEGLGKSTNLAFVKECLERRGRRVIVTREPGGTPLGEQVRAILLGDGQVSPPTELLLVFAARAQHVQDVIRPALENGDWVVSDRFTDASYAYQGGGRGIDAAVIASLERYVQQELEPDLTLLFDAPVEVGLARAKRRGAADRFESEDLDFFRRIREAYLARARSVPQRIRLIDASQALPAVQDQILRCIEAL
ncbi:dTMP kinase [Methyloterricola oryzae]|uniref:dTMP kinase n=1 Tax=Methyloterricola oryzae TaxID=1495050 RepID=UPI0005EB9CC9|nr:dTMP kinase [Methyloterricola oryzae]